MNNYLDRDVRDEVVCEIIFLNGICVLVFGPDIKDTTNTGSGPRSQIPQFIS